MNIEEAIRQKKPFRTEHHKAMVNLLFTTARVRDKITEYLKTFGITLQQYNVLRILRGAGEPITTSIIRERLLDKMSDTSRMVERLSQKGLVERRICERDKRLVDVTLSKKGYRLLEELDKRNDRLDGILMTLTAEEACLLNELLNKIRG